MYSIFFFGFAVCDMYARPHWNKRAMINDTSVRQLDTFGIVHMQTGDEPFAGRKNDFIELHIAVKIDCKRLQICVLAISIWKNYFEHLSFV